MARFPSPGKAWSAISARLHGVRYFLEDVGYALSRVPPALGRGGAAFWKGLQPQTRRHLAAALGVVAGLLVLAVAVVPALPCSFPGGDACAPDDDAAEVVPADAVAYLHLDLDPDTDQFAAAREIAGRLPTVTEQVVGRALAQVPGPNGAPPDFAKDVQPWFGGEAAVALLPAARGAEQVQLLEASDERGARRYADSIAAGTPTSSDYHGVEVRVDDRGLASALTGGFLVIGTESGVRDIVDVTSGVGDARPLSDDDVASEVRDRLPDERLLDVYVSRGGADDLLAGERGPFATVEPFVDAGATRGAAAALVASGDGFELAIRSSLDPERAEADPGFFAAFPEFDPQLPDEIDAAALAYLGFGDPRTTVTQLVRQASAQAPGVAAGFSDLVARLRDLGKVDLERDLLPALGDEAAFALQPGGSGGGAGGQGEPLVATSPPFLEFLASGIDEEQAGQALARLQGPIAGALEGSGQGAPVFTRTKIGDVEAQSLRVSPTVDLTYAVFDSLLVVATDPAGVKQVATGDGGLGDDSLFGEATDGLADDPSLEAYLNVSSLLQLAEQQGLGANPAYATFAQELRLLRALGLGVESSDTELDTNVRVVVGSEPATSETTSIPGSDGTTTPRAGE